MYLHRNGTGLVFTMGLHIVGTCIPTAALDFNGSVSARDGFDPRGQSRHEHGSFAVSFLSERAFLPRGQTRLFGQT